MMVKLEHLNKWREEGWTDGGLVRAITVSYTSHQRLVTDIWNHVT